MGIRKPFDRTLFAANDALARATVQKHYSRQGILLVQNPKRYGIDLLQQEGDVIVAGVECEIKRVWEGPTLPYETVQLPARKLKYLSDAYPITYWIINNDITHALVFPGDLLRSLTPVTVPNKYVPYGEQFFQIPVTSCQYVEVSRPTDEELGVPSDPATGAGEM